MENKEISVIIPIYNAQEYISKCIESILNQSYQNFEIICIDDGSTDASNLICRSFMERETKIRVIEQKNSGPSVARNSGIEHSEGKYICFIDADDTVEREYLEKLHRKIEEGYDLVTCGYRDISRYGIVELNDFREIKEDGTRQEFLESIFRGTGGTLWGKILKRELIMENNLRLNPDIFMCEDQIFILEYFFRAGSFFSLKENLYNYNRLNEKSLSSRVDITYYKNFKNYIENLKGVLYEFKIEEHIKKTLLNNEIEKLFLSMLEGTYSKKIKIREKFAVLETLSKDELLKRDFDPKNSLIRNLKNENYNYVHLMLLKFKYLGKIKNFLRFKIFRRKNESI